MMSLYINHSGAKDKTFKFILSGVQLIVCLMSFWLEYKFIYYSFSSLNLKELLCDFNSHFCNQSFFSEASLAIFNFLIKYSLRGR